MVQGICTVSYLSKIESGKVNPSSEILELLAKRLEITILEAYGGLYETVVHIYEMIFEGRYKPLMLVNRGLAGFIACWLLIDRRKKEVGQIYK